MRASTILVLDGPGELFEQVERALTHMRPRPKVLSCARFDLVEKVVADEGAVDLIIAGPLMSRESDFADLRQLRARVPATKLILAVDRWRTASLRDTVRTGALDLLRLPVTDETLRDTVEQVLELGTSTPLSLVEQAPAVDHEGKVVAVISGTGGCGKTFFATNLAYHLQSRHGRRTCLIDLDLQFGELSTSLRLQPKLTIADLTAHDDDEEFVVRLEEHLVVHDTGMHVLAAPETPGEADGIDAADVARVIQAARSTFDYVIIDTPAALTEQVIAALELSDQIFALATLDLPSVRNLGVLLTTMEQLKIPTHDVKLLLNKVEPDVGIDVGRVAKYFPQGFALTIPYGRDVNRSLNMGQPILAYAPRGDVGKALESGLADFTVVGVAPIAGVPPTRRRLSWLHKRSA